MKNSSPVQLVVLTVAILLGYNAMQTIPYFLWLFFKWFTGGLSIADPFQNMAINLLFIFFYLVSAAVLVKRSKNISDWIADAASLPPNINITLNKHDIFYTALMAMGGYILLTRLPKLLVKSYLFIEEKNDPLPYDGPNLVLPGDSISELSIVIVLAIILIANAKAITRYCIGPFDNGSAIDEIGSKPEEK